MAARVRIPGSDLDVHPLCLGGNVFGWTADAATSGAVLDAYLAAEGNFVDTADSYMWRVEGNTGGDSERVLGDWLADLDAPTVGKAAFKAGVELHELTAEHSDLEEVFLELTSGKAEIR